MADILIRGMEMPQSCDVCPFVGTNDDLLSDDYRYLYCGFPYMGQFVTDYEASRHQDCPLGSLPAGHGRLIDADALDYTMLYKENWMRGTGVEAPAIWKSDIDAADTIVPAEGGKADGDP